MGYVLITGASSDIAKAIAREYAKIGYDLILTGRHDEPLQSLKSDLECRFQVKVNTVALDINKLTEHEHHIENLPDSLIGCVVAVGYLGDQSLAERETGERLNIMQTNFVSIANYLSLIANRLETKKEGFIVCIGSVAGDRGRKKNYVYGASKAGLEAFLSGLRNRLFVSNVQVLTVKPGFVRTKMTNGMALPEKLTRDPDFVGAEIVKAQQKGKNVLYVAKVWYFIMLVIKAIPESIFKRLDL